MSRPREGVDPDIEQTIEDMLPLAGELRQAKAQVEKLGPSGDLLKVSRAKTLVAGIRADVETRAKRIGTTCDALLVILSVEQRLRKQLRRRPARPLVEGALAQQVTERERDLVAAHQAVTAAQELLERATRRAIAAGEARRAFAPVDRARAA